MEIYALSEKCHALTVRDAHCKNNGSRIIAIHGDRYKVCVSHSENQPNGFWKCISPIIKEETMQDELPFSVDRYIAKARYDLACEQKLNPIVNTYEVIFCDGPGRTQRNRMVAKGERIVLTAIGESQLTLGSQFSLANIGDLNIPSNTKYIIVRCGDHKKIIMRHTDTTAMRVWHDYPEGFVFIKR